MQPFPVRSTVTVLVTTLMAVLGAACASGGGPGGTPLPPSVAGTHSVLGRAFFPGGIMVLLDAQLREGQASGVFEYSQVRSGGETSLRVSVEVACIGVFQDGGEAVVAGPVTRVDGDYQGRVGVNDWWMVQVEEVEGEGDLIRSARVDRYRALDMCQQGPRQAATLQAVDGDLSIH